MNDHRWYLVQAHGIAVDLFVPPAAADGLRRRCAPWADIVPVTGPTGAPRVVTGAQAGDALSDDYQEQEGDGALRQVRFDQATRTIWVPDEAERWHHLQLLRAVRNLLRWQALEGGWPCLHGGLVELDGAGLLVAGRKRSGKTSTVLTAVGLLGAGFVSNDDVTVRPEDGGWTGVGWPRSVNVRSDAAVTLSAAVPALKQLRENSTHPRMEYTPPDSAHFTVYPEDICRVLGAPARPAVRVTALVLPVFAETPAAELTRLDPDTAEQHLVEHVDRIATDHDHYLSGWFSPLDDDGVRRHAQRLARELPCYRLVHHLDAAEDTAAALGDLARRG